MLLSGIQRPSVKSLDYDPHLGGSPFGLSIAGLTIIELIYSLDTKVFQCLNASVKHENKKSTLSYLRRHSTVRNKMTVP